MMLTFTTGGFPCWHASEHKLSGEQYKWVRMDKFLQWNSVVLGGNRW